MWGGWGVQVGCFRLFTSLHGGDRPSSAPIIPREPNFPRGNPLGVVAYEVWCPVLQAPAQGHPNIVGYLQPPLRQGRIPPSTHGQNSCPSLPIIPISPLLCARPRGDGTGNTADSTPPPVPSSVIPSIFICSVRRDSIVFDILVVVRSKYQHFVPRTNNYTPAIKKLALSVASHYPFEQTDKANLP